MKYLFDVKIYYKTGAKSELSVVAKNDTEARDKAIKSEEKSIPENYKLVSIKYCEISMVRELAR